MAPSSPSLVEMGLVGGAAPVKGDWAGQSAERGPSGRAWVKVQTSVGSRSRPPEGSWDGHSATLRAAPSLPVSNFLENSPFWGSSSGQLTFFGDGGKVALQTQSYREERTSVGEADFLSPIPGEQQVGGKVCLCS